MAPEELVRRVQLTAVKARSNAAEGGHLHVAETLDPLLYGDGELSLVTVTERMLDGRTPTFIDAYNALVLAERSDAFGLVYLLRWEAEPPTSSDYLAHGLAS